MTSKVLFPNYSSSANTLNCNRWNTFPQVPTLSVMPEGGGIIIIIILCNCGHIYTKIMFLQKMSRWKLKSWIYWYVYICRYLVFCEPNIQIFVRFCQVLCLCISWKDDYIYHMPEKTNYFDKKCSSPKFYVNFLHI